MTEVTIKLSDEIVADVCNHVIGFVKFEDGAKQLVSGGSGTLVRIGKMRGILTAAHVSAALPEGTVGLVRFSKPDWNLKLNMNHTRYVDIWDGRAGSAPDIALISVPDVDADTIEAQGGVFYNLEKDRTFSVSDQANKLAKSYAISGVVAEWIEKQETGKPAIVKVVFGGIWGAGKNVKEFKEGNVDLVSLQIDYDASLRVPRSYGGASGSGLWELYTELTPGLTIVTVGKKLCGVAFREEDRETDRHSIISNAQLSLLHLIAKLRQQWDV